MTTAEASPENIIETIDDVFLRLATNLDRRATSD